MKVLLISPLPPPVGGIASWTVNLLNYLSNKPDGYEIIHQNTALKFQKILNNDVLSRLFFGIIESIRIINNFKSNIKEHKPNVIHLTSSASFALIKDYFIIKLAERRKIPLVIHWRFGRIPELANIQNWEWKMLCIVIRKSHTSIVIDKESYNTLINKGFNNVVKISNPIGIDIEQKINLNLKSRKRRHDSLVFVGHIIKNKGVLELVEACSQLTIIKELVLIGPYDEIIKKQILELANKRDDGEWLIMPGTLDKNDVLERMQNSTVLALPSYTEGFPNVVIEAMSMGCAVIATDVGAIPEMLAISTESPCGICIPVKNMEKLRDAIMLLSNNPDITDNMGKRGVERILNHYTLERVIEQYKSVWKIASNG